LLPLYYPKLNILFPYNYTEVHYNYRNVHRNFSVVTQLFAGRKIKCYPKILSSRTVFNIYYHKKLNKYDLGEHKIQYIFQKHLTNLDF